MNFDSLHLSSKDKFNYKKGQKVIFLDRDGTINYENPLEKAEDDLKLIPLAPLGIKILNDLGFFVVVASNQPRVGRNQVSEKRLREQNKLLEEELKKANGARLDEILYCPHAIDAVLPNYKIDCPWKKPKPGMLEFISKKLNINLKNTFFIGNGEKDIAAGKATRVKTIYISPHGKNNFLTKPDYIVKNLKEAAYLVAKLISS